MCRFQLEITYNRRQIPEKLFTIYRDNIDQQKKNIVDVQRFYWCCINTVFFDLPNIVSILSIFLLLSCIFSWDFESLEIVECKFWKFPNWFSKPVITLLLFNKLMILKIFLFFLSPNITQKMFKSKIVGFRTDEKLKFMANRKSNEIL